MTAPVSLLTLVPRPIFWLPQKIMLPFSCRPVPSRPVSYTSSEISALGGYFWSAAAQKVIYSREATATAYSASTTVHACLKSFPRNFVRKCFHRNLLDCRGLSNPCTQNCKLLYYGFTAPKLEIERTLTDRLSDAVALVFVKAHILKVCQKNWKHLKMTAYKYTKNWNVK